MPDRSIPAIVGDADLHLHRDWHPRDAHAPADPLPHPGDRSATLHCPWYGTRWGEAEASKGCRAGEANILKMRPRPKEEPIVLMWMWCLVKVPVHNTPAWMEVGAQVGHGDEWSRLDGGCRCGLLDLSHQLLPLSRIRVAQRFAQIEILTCEQAMSRCQCSQSVCL